MKRGDLIRHLDRNGCVLLREGAAHAGIRGVSLRTEKAISARLCRPQDCEREPTNRRAAVPRHTEIANLTADRICDDLAIPRVEKK
jgi:hypothetical protein